MFSSNTSQVAATVTQAEAIDYDTTNDYLLRDTTYNGYVNAFTFLKDQFTFSCWFYNGEAGGSSFVFSSGASSGNADQFYVNVSTDMLEIRAYDGSGTAILAATRSNTFPLNTFCNVIVSCDMTNLSNRHVYVNDQPVTMTWSTYVDSTIQFGTSRQRVNSLSNSVSPVTCRISNLFLDFTFRNLSVTDNRRLFITADLKPAAGQAALNPILYLPMSDPTQPGLNQGTGGNFTLNGVVARSGRGPNQYNAPYSDLDGAADYLSRTTAPAGIADGKQFTLVFSYRPDVIGGTAQTPICFSSSTSVRFDFYVDTDGSAYLRAYNSAALRILQATFAANTFVAGRNYVVACSIDLSSTSTRHVYINGQSVSPTWTNYSNDTIQFYIAAVPRYRVGANQTPSGYVNGGLGALWFNTSYIDLSVPSNLAKFVTGTGINAKPVDLGASGELPTGTSPLIYLPMYGNNAGKNYGTGGDFTVNSGPYTGARGPNEFWGNKADFDGSTGYLAQTSALSGISNSKTISCSFFYNPDASGTDQEIVSIQGSTFVWGLRVYREGSTNKLNFVAQNSSNATILNAITGSAFTTGSYFIQASFDLANTSNRSIYVNGVLDTTTWSTYTNDTASFTNRTNPVIGARLDGTYGRFLNGKLAEFYFTTEYVDFKQEANRLKFRDAFGNPVDLTQQIEAAAIPNPAIYMRFPPTSFGTNYGTGGNFTVNGTITDGGQL
jgi:hypothetical protein